MACTPRRPGVRDVLTSPGRLLVALAGAGCLVATVVVNGLGSVVELLLPVGGALLLIAVAWSAISGLSLNLGVLSVALTGAVARREALGRFCEGQRADLELAAVELCVDAQRAADAASTAVQTAASSWAGPLDESLRRYLLCVLVRAAAHQETVRAWTSAEATADPGPALSAWSTLSMQQRAVLLLVDREGIAPGTVAGMLDRTEDEVCGDLLRLRARLADVAGAS